MPVSRAYRGFQKRTHSALFLALKWSLIVFLVVFLVVLFLFSPYAPSFNIIHFHLQKPDCKSSVHTMTLEHLVLRFLSFSFSLCFSFSFLFFFFFFLFSF